MKTLSEALLGGKNLKHVSNAENKGDRLIDLKRGDTFYFMRSDDNDKYTKLEVVEIKNREYDDGTSYFEIKSKGKGCFGFFPNSFDFLEGSQNEPFFIAARMEQSGYVYMIMTTDIKYIKMFRKQYLKK